MAATAAVKRLKEGADVILRTALEQRDRPPNEQVPQDVQERLAADTLTAAKEIDDIFERTKLAASEETEEEVQREVGAMLTGVLACCFESIVSHIYVCVGLTDTFSDAVCPHNIPFRL